MLLRVDIRENKLISILKQLLENNNKIQLQTEQLNIGDIILENGKNKLIIERKSINDLSASISGTSYSITCTSDKMDDSVDIW